MEFTLALNKPHHSCNPTVLKKKKWPTQIAFIYRKPEETSNIYDNHKINKFVSKNSIDIRMELKICYKRTYSQYYMHDNEISNQYS